MTDEETAFYTEVGKRVTVHRTACGLTQAELAPKASLARSSIANLEAGRQAVPLYKLDEVARALGISVTSLLPGAEIEGRPLKLKQAAEKARAALDEFLALFAAATDAGQGQQ